MDIETISKFCKSLPSVTEDIKWGNDLCFSVGGKMFCVTNLEPPLQVSLKVKDDEFDELSNKDGIKPAPYVARYKWILVENDTVFTKSKWKYYIKQSYELVRAKLPKKIKENLH